ncbi:MAG: hydrogenase subunit MbhD domain-containing protein [Candidatus Cloacimonadota bacterium]|nr:hydrogenase subunit MbhD domain-containing protein [Candidatus Cloacimonadota bacterium]
MIQVIIIVLGIIMLLAAILAIYSRNLIAAVISAGVISLFASIIYLLLAAPDVAMTEAAIGSGLTTIIFLFAIKKIKEDKEDSDG